jgi:cysteine-rich repeat protein
MLISVRQYRGLSALVLMGVAGAFGAAGCSDTFTSCYETHTCPRVGTDGGEGGTEAGGAGEAAVAGSEASGGSGADTETSGGESQGGSSPTAALGGESSAGEGGEPSVVPEEGCGDGVVQVEKEECDDENATSGDGCSDACTVEPVQIVALDSRICALGANGRIRCFAVGAADWSWEDVNLGAGERAVAVAAGSLQLGTLCAILSTGSVRCWGSNHSGKLGAGSQDDRALSDAAPDIDLGPDEIATSVTVGDRHACAVVRNGKVKCWGSNAHGQLGHPENPPNEAVGDGPGEMGAALIVVPETVGRKAETVSAGANYTCILRTDQTMRCWGDHAPGAHTAGLEMNLGSVLTVSQATAGESHACALLTNGQMKCWGGNFFGQLGQDDVAERNTTAAMGDKLLPIWLGAGRTPKHIATGSNHSCAVLDDGSLKCWGHNATGLLGKGDKVNVGGLSGDMAALKPIDLGGRSPEQLAFGTSTSCALLSDGRVACWGGVNTPSIEFLGDQPDEMGDNLPIVPLKF